MERKPFKGFQYPARYRLHRCQDPLDAFDRFFRFSPQAILLIDPAGNILKVNPAFNFLVGYNGVTNRAITNIYDCIPSHQHFVFNSHLGMIARDGVPSTNLEGVLIRQETREFPVRISFGVYQLQPRAIIQLFIQDITDYRMSEEQTIQAQIELELSYTATLDGWSRALELRDRETEGHSERVCEKTIEIALRIGIGIEKLNHIRHGALLHDIGKMAIPDSILFKPGPLSVQERRIMEQHTTYAYHLLSPVKYLKPALNIPFSHHERWDGKGYPQHLKGEEIPLEARVFSIVDVWDALNSDRPYRKAWSIDRTKEYIWDNREVQFDPTIVNEFLATV